MTDTNMCVWVTGAGTGIGRAVAAAFAAQGRNIALSGRNEGTLNETAEAIRFHGSDILVVPCDVSDSHSVASAHMRIREELGAVDTLVNNAGATIFRGFMDSTPEEFDQLTGTNLRGPFLCSQAVLPGMIERGAGTIVMINSVASRTVFSDSSVYSMTKSGLKMLADCLRHEVRASGIRVISVYPGATNTEIWPGKIREKHGHKMMLPEEVADVLTHACALPQSVLVEDIYMQPVGGAL